MRNYKIVMMLAIVVVFVAAAAHLSVAQDAAKKENTYIGNTKCSMCHKGAAKGEIHEKWLATAHAKTLEQLPADQKTNAKCLGCHTTGYGKPGGYDPAKKNELVLGFVGCEACHGPGSNYQAMSVMKDPAKAKAAGLLEPNEASCKACHAGAVPEGHKALKFDFATAKPKIEHHIPKK